MQNQSIDFVAGFRALNLATAVIYNQVQQRVMFSRTRLADLAYNYLDNLQRVVNPNRSEDGVQLPTGEQLVNAVLATMPASYDPRNDIDGQPLPVDGAAASRPGDKPDPFAEHNDPEGAVYAVTPGKSIGY